MLLTECIGRVCARAGGGGLVPVRRDARVCGQRPGCAWNGRLPGLDPTRPAAGRSPAVCEVAEAECRGVSTPRWRVGTGRALDPAGSVGEVSTTRCFLPLVIRQLRAKWRFRLSP